MSKSFDRRTFLYGLLASAAFTAGGIPGFIKNALAMGKKDYPQGMHEIEGDVRINGKAARTGDIVNPGDVVTTGPPKSHAVFVLGMDAYLLRHDTRLEIEKTPNSLKDQAADLLRLVNGKILAVFSKGNKKIITPTAIAGVRGTGIYVEAEPAISYICTCYGNFEIESRSQPQVKQSLKAKHHDAARYIYASGRPEQIMIKAPMKNHTDAELIMLESLVGRKPPFVKINAGAPKEKQGNGGGY